MKIFKLPLIILAVLYLSSCGDALKYRKVDANEFPPDPKLRIKKNMEEGRGFRLLDTMNNRNSTYDFLAQIHYGELPWIL